MAKLPPPPKQGEPLSARWGRDLLAWCASVNPVSSADIGVRTTANGTAHFIKRKGGAGGGVAAVHPLQAVDYSNASGAAVRIRSGTVDNIIPTIDGASLTVDIDDDDNAVLYLGASDKAIVINAHFTNGSMDSASIFSQATTIVPADDIDADTRSGDTYRVLAFVTVNAPTGSGPWSVTIADDLLGSLVVQVCGTQGNWGSAG